MKKNAKKLGHIKKKLYLCSVIQNNYKGELNKSLKINTLLYFTYCRLGILHIHDYNLFTNNN